jgi:NAD(P)-dependent dehydrogenase (short-subunit alcohol dehydrogenase family)
VNNAGAVERVKVADLDEATWNNTIAVNLTGTFLCTRTALPHMLRGGWGRIINIASIGARHAVPYAPAYTAAKHGVLGFTRAVALEMAPRGITANAICPGWVETDMAEAAISQIVQKTGRTPEQARKSLEQMSPQQRMVQPEEVAALAVLLASDDARSITGQGLNICGGSVMS